MVDLVDDAGRLQFGKAHRGEDINDIAADDPSYLHRERSRSNPRRVTARQTHEMINGDAIKWETGLT